jgi:hypothetical protein
MPVFLINVSDELTIQRSATLLVEADNMTDAKEIALERCHYGIDIDWDEEQIDAEPYDVSGVDDEMAGELVELITTDKTRPGPLDHDERERMEELIRYYHVSNKEIGRFRPTKT